MMKKRRKFLITIVVVIILSNTWPFSAILKIMVDGDMYYRYSNFDGSNTSYEFKSWTFEMAKSQQERCIKSHPEQKDKNLYRLFKINPFAFWRWKLYLFDERYKLPYKDWGEIERKRKSSKVKYETGCVIRF